MMLNGRLVCLQGCVYYGEYNYDAYILIESSLLQEKFSVGKL